jgi:beta-phosphoglucomutase-like phosphatase (HAD superfamily)
VHSCADLSVLGPDGRSTLGADEIELPIVAVLDETDHPRPGVGELFEQWREAGIVVTVTGVDYSSALQPLRALGVAQATGTALVPAASELGVLPRSLQQKG